MDMAERYGLDLTPALLRARRGRWLRLRVRGLTVTGTRLHAALWPQEGG